MPKAAKSSTPKHPQTRNNLIRANWTNEAVNTFAESTGLGVDFDRDDAVADLLTGLMHYSDAYGLDFEAELERAVCNYLVDQNPEEDDVALQGEILHISR